MINAKTNKFINAFYTPRSSPLKLRLPLGCLKLSILRALKISPTKFASNN